MKTTAKEKLMQPSRVHLNQKQKRQLMKRARISGRSVSEEARSAIDFYLDLPIKAAMRTEEELAGFFCVVNRSADRIVRKLDEIILHVERVLKPKVKVHRRSVSF
jgi:hypothetical protein